MPVLIQVNFDLQGPWGEEMATQFHDLAASINNEPGFIWKVWIEDASAGLSGGIYLFEDRATAESYIAMHTDRLAGFGIQPVEVVYSDVNVPLSTLNRATLSGAG